MPDGPVVVNNTPLVALWVLDRLDLLRDLYGTILIPRAVQTEFLSADQPVRHPTLTSASWIEVAQLTHPRRALAYAGLDQGEAEVLALAEERDARLVLIDERKGRRFAKRLGLPLSGTLGTLLLAKESGMLDSVTASVDQLKSAGLHLSPALVEAVLIQAEEQEQE